MYIAIYARKSRLTDTGDSIQMQIEKCKNYLSLLPSLQQYEIKLYQDEGFSGGNTNRPDFRRLLMDCMADTIAYVVCYKIDRFSRNLADFSSTYRILEEHHVHFISITDQFDTSTPIGRAMLNIAMVFAELERDTITQRIRDNLIHLAHSGKWLGGTPPLGYQVITQKSFQDGHEKIYKQLSIDPQFAPIVRLIYEQYQKLGSLTSLAAYLSKNSIKTRNNNQFGINSLREILTNPTYCSCELASYKYFEALGCHMAFIEDACIEEVGLMPFNRTHSYTTQTSPSSFSKYRSPSEWIIAMGSHPPLIAAKLWLATQEQIKHNASKCFNKKCGATSQVSLLSGLIFCQKCGTPMKVTNQSRLKNGTTSYIYRCSNKLHSHGKLCNVSNLKGHYLDTFLLETLAQTINDPNELITQLLVVVKNNHLNDTKPLNISQHLDKQLQTTNQQIKLLLQRLSSTEPIDPKAQQYIKILEDEIKALITKKEQLSGQMADNTLINASDTLQNHSSHILIDQLTHFDQLLLQASRSEKQQFLRQIIQKLEWDGETIHIYFASAFL